MTDSCAERLFTPIEDAIKDTFGITHPLSDGLFSISTYSKIGDFKFLCEPLAKSLKENVDVVVQKIDGILSNKDVVECKIIVWPNVYFKFRQEYLHETVCKDVLKAGKSYGNCNLGNRRKVNLSFPSPNLNKPLHLGHLRNVCVGMALNNILEAANFEVIRTCTMSDCGIHICKSMVAYKETGTGKTPESMKVKGDHFVGQLYILFEKKFEEELKRWLLRKNLKNNRLAKKTFFNHDSVFGYKVKKLLKEWENGDREILELWKKMNKWVLEGFKRTFLEIGIDMDAYYDRIFYESEIYDMGKKIVLEKTASGICKKNENNSVSIDLRRYGLGRQVLLRSDGSPLYTAINVASDVQRFAYYPDLYQKISILGNEQAQNIKIRSKILEVFEYKDISKKFHPVTYGMVHLSTGERMKSRKGLVLYVDDLIKNMTEILKCRILKSTQNDISEKAKAIGLAMIKYYLLSKKTKKDIHYESNRIMSTNGAAVFFIFSVLTKIESVKKDCEPIKLDKIEYSLFTEQGKRLILKIWEFNRVVKRAASLYEPSIIARYINELAKTYNNFYNKYPELTKPDLALAEAVKIVLENALFLLNINPTII